MPIHLSSRVQFWFGSVLAGLAANGATVEIQPIVTETDRGCRVEYRSQDLCVVRPAETAPSGVQLKLPGGEWVPVGFRAMTQRGSATGFDPGYSAGQPRASLFPPATAGGEPPDTNYDEAKVPPYELPDPLVTFDGQKVSDAKAWCEKRRPEILRSYAVATFHGGDVELDRHGSGCRFTEEEWHKGIRGFILRQSGRTELLDDEWGSLGAWAWGLSRALGYLQTNPDLDGVRVAVFGHSRTGKAALWAGAQDERFALVISNNSGEGGAALARRRYGETVAASYALSGIWCCRNYAAFGRRESELPVDAHLLIALMAPRPVYIASAEQDRWADPRGEFLAARHAEPVYRFFRLSGLGTDAMPNTNQPVGQTIGYHIRSGDHEITPYDWQCYLDFADRHLRRATALEW